MPTVLELAGVASDALVTQGDSLVDLIEGRRLSEWRNRVVLSEESTQMSKADLSAQRGLRVTGSVHYRGWHLIASREFWPRRFLPEALRLKVFDVDEDPDESRPAWSFVADPWLRYRYVQLIDRIQRNHAEARKRWASDGDEEVHRMDPDSLDQLKALGYIE
jgi:hypothetical protein